MNIRGRDWKGFIQHHPVLQRKSIAFNQGHIASEKHCLTKDQNDTVVVRGRAGFTLVEMMIVAAIFSVTVLVATTVFVNIQSFQRGILGRQRVVADGRYVLETVARTAKLGLPDYTFYANGYTVACVNDDVPGGTPTPCSLTYPQSMLVVRDQINAQTCYRLNPATSSLETSNDCTGLATVWTDITPADLVINDFRVYIHPDGDPFRPPPTVNADCQTGVVDVDAGVCSCLNNTQCWAGQTCVTAADPNVACSGGPCLCKNKDFQPRVSIYLNTSSRTTGPGQAASAVMETTVTSRIYRR